MSYRYAVLGGGRQGTAAAYDLAVFGGAERVFIADRDESVARESVAQVNRLVDKELAEPRRLDVTDRQSLVDFLRPVDSLLSAVPYTLNPAITDAAIDSRTHMCDLGGNTRLVRQQLAADARARAAAISVIPDCGQVPGMGTSLMAFAIDRLDEPFGVKLWDGGIPLEPREPWNYVLTFNIGGLTNEYAGTTVFLRDGRRCEVECFEPAGYERLEFGPPFGELEAFVTAGGTSTTPWSWAGRLQFLENRTLRYPGHAAQWRAFSDAGLLSLEPIELAGTSVVPRQVLHALLAPRLEPLTTDRDAILVRVLASGRHQGRPAEVQVDLVDYSDEQTGFTAMQRCTGFDAAIVCAMMAREETPRGAIPREISVDPQRYVEELERRRFDIGVASRFTDDEPSAH